jgi:tetratricopeptide (TPR) repeat protein
VKRTAPFWVDVWSFLAQIQQTEPQALAAALTLNRGELLPELYEEWLWPHRLHCQERYLTGVMRLAQHHLDGQAWEQAQSLYHRALQIDPLYEEAHQKLMLSLARMDRLGEALNAYERLVALLDDELSAPPSQATQELAGHIFRELELARQAATPARPVKLPFVGRLRERSALLAVVEKAIQGSGGAIAVSGPGGIGKSRLLEEVAAGARWRGAAVVWGHTTQRPGTSPLAPLLELFAEALAGPKAAQLETLLPPEILAAFAPLHPPWRAIAELPDLPTERALQRFHQAVLAVTRGLTSIGPLVLILDDLHWASPACWAILDRLVHVAPDLPCVLLLSFRRAEIEDNSGWGIVQSSERQGLLHPVTLTELNLSEVAQLLPADQLEEAPDIWAVTGGNPFYLSHLLSATGEGQSLHRQTLQQRLALLPPPIPHALAAAAVIGRAVPYHLWLHTAALSAQSLVAASSTLVTANVLEPVEGGYSFTHDLVVETVYNRIDEQERHELHRRAAAALALQSPSALRGRAYHLQQAGDREAAAQLLREAAAADMAAFAYVEAQQALEQALADWPEDDLPARLALSLELGRVCDVSGALAQRTTTLQQAIDLAHQLDQPEMVLTATVQLADTLGKTGQHASAAAHFAAATEMAQQLGAEQQMLQIYLDWADLDIREGDFGAARRRFETAVELARRLGDRLGEGRALDGLGWVIAGVGGTAAEVIPIMESALAVIETTGNRYEIARTRLNLFNSLQSAGLWDRLLPMMEPLLADLRAVHYMRGEASALQAICWMHCGLGDYPAAQRAAESARSLFAATDDQLGVSISLGSMGVIARDQGDDATALDYFHQSLAIVNEVGSALHATYTHQDIGLSLVNQGELAAAIPHLRTAIAGWQEVGEQINQLRCETALAHSLIRLGDAEEAAHLAERLWRSFYNEHFTSSELLQWYHVLYDFFTYVDPVKAEAVLGRAYQELMAQAAVIVDHDVRRRFLHQVPAHQTLLDAYGARQPVQQVVQAVLARVDAPTGRTLHPEERVTVNWTIKAPEDVAIVDKSERRRYVLQRLLAEAAAQAAAPADADLAQALGVSRRTVLRDIQELARDGFTAPTRVRRHEPE